MRRSKKTWLLALSMSAMMLGTAGMFAACGETECEHEWGEWSVTTQSTCTAKGEETRVCKKDATHTETREVEMKAHAIQQREGQAATCTEDGWKAYEECENCDYTTYEAIPAQHTIVEHEGKAPTCTEDGWKAYEECENCDYTTYEAIPAQHTIVEHEGKAPTYTEDGWEAYETCSVCEEYNTYKVAPKLNVGETWGSVNDNLVAANTWNVASDNGDAPAISLTSAAGDNNIYMWNVVEENVYVEVQINATGVLNNEKFGKIGLTVTSADGQKGIFYYIDAASADGLTINDTASGLGYNVKANGGWTGNWQAVGSIGAPATAYTGDNYVTLGIYRQGGAFSLYVNDTFVKTVSCDILAGDEAYIGLASFNITANVKGYSAVTEEADLAAYAIERQTISNLFIGDSYVDTNFWYTYATDLGATAGNVNLGIGGTQTDDWQYKVGLLQQQYALTNIVLNIGVNDIDDDKATGEETIARLQNLFATYHEAFPEATIIYMSIVDNMLFSTEWEDYAAVRAWMDDNAGEGEYAYVTYVDYNQYLTKDANGSTQMWFNGDGLHLGIDGYAVWTREIKRALGIERTVTAGGLGDIAVEGAPAFSYSAGWTVDADVWHNTGIHEQQVFISNAYGEDVYAEATISVAGNTLATEAWGKAGLAIRSTKGTWFFFLNCADGSNGGGTYYNDTWGNIIFRPETINRNWTAEVYREYMPFYGTSFDYNTDGNFKHMAVAKIGTDLYFISDGRILNVLTDVLAADDKIAVSVFNFNMDMYAKDAVAYNESTPENALINKLNSLKIYEDTDNITIDGSASDWKDSMKATSYVIPAAGGKSVTINATLGASGVYLYFDAIHGTYKDTTGAWHTDTNFEIRFGTDNRLRYASAGGWLSFWRENDTRNINVAKFVTEQVDGKAHTKAEAFISYACIEGLDRGAESVNIGFSWKTGGDGGNVWENNAAGDYWYVAENAAADHNTLITANGIVKYEPTTKTIDGNLADWEGELVTGVTGDANRLSTRVGTKYDATGLYVAVELKAKNLAFYKTEGEWWQRTNLEIRATENIRFSRFMVVDGVACPSHWITAGAVSYVDGGEAEDTIVFEFFIAAEIMLDAADTITFTMGGQTWFTDGGVNIWTMYFDGAKIAKTVAAE